MSQTTTNTEDTIDLKQLLTSLLAQWKTIIATSILGGAIGVTYLHITPNTYSVDAMLQVEDKKGAAASVLLGDLGNLAAAGSNSATLAETEILRSRSVLSKAIEHLHLNVKIADSRSGLWYNLHNLSNHPHRHHTEYTPDGIRFTEAHHSFFIQKFQVPPAYLDRPLILTFVGNQQFTLSDEDEKQVFKGQLNQLNTLSNGAGLWQIQINSKSSFDHTFTLVKQSEPMALQTLLKQYAVGEKGKNSGMIALSMQGTDPKHITKVLNDIVSIYHENNILRKTLESQQTLKFLDKQLPELKQQLEDAEQKFNQFRENNNTVDVNQESQLLLKQNIELDTKRLELQQKRAELSARYTDDFPLMVEINSQISALENKAKQLSSTLTQLPEKQRQYLQLYRDVQVNTQLYTNLLNSYQQLKIAEAGEIGSVRIIDRAIEPVKPIKPKKLIILALSVFVGLFLGILLALARNLLRFGIQSSKDMEEYLDLPVYASIPRSKSQEHRIKMLKRKSNIPILAIKDSEDIAVEALRSVRTALHFALMNAKNNIILLTGPSPEIGKSFIAVNLATVFAQNHKRVLLIDADMRRGYLNKYFKVDNQLGLSNYLLNPAISVEQITHQSNDLNTLHFISRGANPPNPAELLESERFAQLINQITSQYDYIIIDTPPALAVTDPVILAQYAGINIMTARFEQTKLKELEISINRFEQAGFKVNGLILNDVLANASSEEYSYTYHYKADKS